MDDARWKARFNEKCEEAIENSERQRLKDTLDESKVSRQLIALN